MPTQKAVVVGAGLAGLSAATYLLEKGIQPLVIEALPYVGGRTASWNAKGMEVETGLHRFLGFYNHLPQLLQTAGLHLDDVLVWEDEIEIRAPDGPQAIFGLSPLHKPLKTFWRLMGNNHFLSPKDKLSLQRFFLFGIKDYVRRPAYLDSLTVLEYAHRHNVTQNGIERLLIPLTEGIFFLPISSYSAYVLFGLVVPYWKSLYKLRVGAFRGGMTKVMAEPLAHSIRSKGGEFVLDQPVTRIHRTEDSFMVVTKGKQYQADAVILAASLYPAQQIIQRSFRDAWFKSMLRLQTMPSVTFQIELREPSLPQDRITFGPLTCMSAFAEQSRTTFRGSKGRLSIILSPPHTFVHMKSDDILDKVLHDATRLGLHLTADNVLSYRKVVIPHDFYLLSPGAEALRPAQKTPIPGLFLAGDYTRQKYLATMEGAAYSGKRAAHLAHDYLKKELL